MSILVQRVVKMKSNRINYTQVVWEITKLLQEADSLEDALRTSLGEVIKAVGAERAPFGSTTPPVTGGSIPLSP